MSVMEIPTPAPSPAPDAAARLAELEQVVAAGLDHYVKVGRALQAIHVEQLFRATHETWKGYLAGRWKLSESRGFSLLYSAEVADVLEAAGEAPQGSEAALRELAPVLHQKGAQAAVEAFRAVADAGTLPPASRTRERLREAGHVDRPPRAPADQFLARLTALEGHVVKIKPHPKLSSLLFDYSQRTRAVADTLEQLAADSAAPIDPLGDLCLEHGARRDSTGVCFGCRRPDVRREPAGRELW
jgi:hypothetical protein